jgi:hypothetical protein
MQMKTTTKILALFILVLMLSSGCGSIREFFQKPKEVTYPSIANNVCKTLKDEVVLYAVFIDSKYTSYWTTHDIKTTLDSINKATRWLETKAKESGIHLNIKVVQHQNGEMIPIEVPFPGKSLSATLNSTNGLKKLDKWSDKAARTAGLSLPKDTAKSVRPQNIGDLETLLARLRSIHKTDDVAVMYFINNFYKREISVAKNTLSGRLPEFSVVSEKTPAVIAHEFLHLFGADDLYLAHDKPPKNYRKKKELAMKEFPNEIMAFAYRNIESLDISPVTKYMIGWEKSLDTKYSRIMFSRKYKPLKY